MNKETTKLTKPSFPQIHAAMLDRLSEQAEQLAAKPAPEQERRVKRFFRFAA